MVTFTDPFKMTPTSSRTIFCAIQPLTAIRVESSSLPRSVETVTATPAVQTPAVQTPPVQTPPGTAAIPSVSSAGLPDHIAAQYDSVIDSVINMGLSHDGSASPLRGR